MMKINMQFIALALALFDECGCGETALMNIEEFGKVTLERVWTPYVVVPQFAYLQPMVGKIKTTGYSS